MNVKLVNPLYQVLLLPQREWRPGINPGRSLGLGPDL